MTKTNNHTIHILLAGACLLMMLASCKKLSLQKDYDRTSHTLDPNLNKSAGQFLKDRANGALDPKDTIFRRMMQGLQYAEIDLNEFEKTGKTFILLHNDAIYRTAKVNNKDSVQTDCFFGANYVNGKVGTKWEDYPKDFVRNFLLYHIVDGVYDHYTMKEPGRNYESTTLAPPGTLVSLPAGITRAAAAVPFTPNPSSHLKLKVVNSSPSNTSDYPIVLNDVRNVRTSSLLATNGTVHVIDRFLSTTLPE